MSTTEAASSADPITTHKLTRGGLYQITQAFKRPEAFTKAGTLRRALRLAKRLRALNPTRGKVGDIEYDFSKGFARLPDETEPQWAQRQLAFNDAWEKWQAEETEITVTMREKHLVEKVIRWALKDRTSQKAVWPNNTDHHLSILDAFPAVTVEEGAEEDEEENE